MDNFDECILQKPLPIYTIKAIGKSYPCFEELKGAVGDGFNLIDNYEFPPTTTANPTARNALGRREAHGIELEWIKKYSSRQPSVIVILLPQTMSNMEPEEKISLVSELQQINSNASRLSIGLVILSPSELQSYMAGLLKESKINPKVLFSLRSTDQRELRATLREQSSNFYREQIRKYKRSLYGGKDGLYPLPMLHILHYQFKIGWMEMMLGDWNNAVKAMNTGYSALIDYCKRTFKSTLGLSSLGTASAAVADKTGVRSPSISQSPTISVDTDNQRASLILAGAGNDNMTFLPPPSPLVAPSPSHVDLGVPNASQVVQQTLELFRWICDVMTIRIIWMMIDRLVERDLKEADEYFNGHITWFTPSHSTEASLFGWKAKMYSAMAEILLNAERGERRVLSPKIEHHPGYYYFLASKYSIASFAPSSDIQQSQEFQSHVEKTIDLLIKTYDYCQLKQAAGMTLQIGRLISSQYILIGDYSQAFQTLNKLRLAYERVLPSKALLGDILLELVAICQKTGDFKGKKEFYWYYASLYPEVVMDDFDAIINTPNADHEDVMTSTDAIVSSSATTAEAFIDIATVGGTLMACSARFSSMKAMVGENIAIEVLLCNMSPAAFTLGDVLVRLSDGTQLSAAASASDQSGFGIDFIPGFILQLHQTYSSVTAKSVTIDSVSVHFKLAHLWIYFSLPTLSTVESVADLAWDDPCVNWPFIRRLRKEGFIEDALSLSIQPLLPQIDLSQSVAITPLIEGNLGILKLVLKRDDARFPLECVIKLFCQPHDQPLKIMRGIDHSFHNPYGHAQGRDVIEISEFGHRLIMLGEQETIEIAIISSASQSYIMQIDVEGQFTDETITNSLIELSPDAIVFSKELKLDFINPIAVDFLLESLPTEVAIDPPVQINPHIPLALVQYKLSVIIRISQKYSKDKIFIRSAVLRAIDGAIVKNIIPLKESDIVTKLLGVYEISSSALALPASSSIQTSLAVDWSLVDRDATGGAWDFANTFTGPIISFTSSNILIIPHVPNRESVCVGSLNEYSWFVWNMTSQEHDVTVRLEAGEGYIWMGPKQLHLRLDLHSTRRITGWMIPLAVGPLKAPALKVISSGATAAAGEVLNCTALNQSEHIFVLPPLNCTL